MIRFLSEGKLMSGNRRGILLTESDQYALGDGVTVTARLFNERFEPLVREAVVAEYKGDGQRRECSLKALRDRPGWFEGSFVPDQTGPCRITVSMDDRSTGRRKDIAREIFFDEPIFARVVTPNLTGFFQSESVETLEAAIADAIQLRADQAPFAVDLVAGGTGLNE